MPEMGRKIELIPIEKWEVFQQEAPLLICGPCGAESEAQVMNTAAALKECGVSVFRAGLWKPRTHPNTFEGVGERGLEWLGRVRNELGMKVCTEVASARHVRECVAAGMDMVWIGARTTANPFLVQEIAEALEGTDIPVLVKNPVNPDLELWIGALERLNQCGVRKIGVVHRGFSTLEKQRYRNAPQWQVAVELRRLYPELPFFCDPSHISGNREYIGEVAQRALDLGLDGLMIESHYAPEYALSDASQQLSPAELSRMLSSLTVRSRDSDNPEYREDIERLRAEIDVIDENILALLSSRMKISRRIGESKKKSNIAILQTSRWDAVLAGVIARGRELGLSEKFVTELFNLIHDSSIQTQNEIISGDSQENS